MPPKGRKKKTNEDDDQNVIDKIHPTSLLSRRTAEKTYDAMVTAGDAIVRGVKKFSNDYGEEFAEGAEVMRKTAKGTATVGTLTAIDVLHSMAVTLIRTAIMTVATNPTYTASTFLTAYLTPSFMKDIFLESFSTIMQNYALASKELSLDVINGLIKIANQCASGTPVEGFVPDRVVRDIENDTVIMTSMKASIIVVSAYVLAVTAQNTIKYNSLSTKEKDLIEFVKIARETYRQEELERTSRNSSFSLGDGVHVVRSRSNSTSSIRSARSSRRSPSPVSSVASHGSFGRAFRNSNYGL